MTCRDHIPPGHKLAITGIDQNAPVRKYNQIIGFASRPIAQGEHVHTHNLETRAFSRDPAIGLDRLPTNYVTEQKRATFHGILRADGRVATRNYIGVLTTVNCSATVARYIADSFRGDALSDFPNVDGVVALCHGTGCGMDLLTHFARGRLRRQMARSGASPDELRSIERMVPPDRLTIGFARRFATYKRANLLFHNVPWLQAILTNPDRPVQIVFAGKAHPADKEGQALIRQIFELAQTPELKGHLYLLEDYDMRMGRFLTQGVDVWLNNPRPPKEASGTSGMKAALNGVLNLSVMDGWWVEGYNEKNGWAFGYDHDIGDAGRQDNEDALALYTMLQDEIVPLFYDRNDNGVPVGWVERMKESMASCGGRFSAHRMVADYTELAYVPLGTGVSSKK